MCLALTACGGKKETAKSYAGKYLLTEMTDDSGEVYDDFLKESWADKSFYEYCEITEDNLFSVKALTNGEVTTLAEFYFDPATQNIYADKDMKQKTSDVLTFTDNGFKMETDGSSFFFLKTDEIPD